MFYMFQILPNVHLEVEILTNISLPKNCIDTTKEPRTIGLSMIPGHHIISVEIDSPKA